MYNKGLYKEDTKFAVSDQIYDIINALRQMQQMGGIW